MSCRGIIKRVPRELLVEAEIIKSNKGGTLMNAFRLIATEYSPTGRKVKESTIPQFFFKETKDIIKSIGRKK